MNFHTQLIRFSHIRYDKIINVIEYVADLS